MSNGSINNFSSINPALTGINWSGIGLGSNPSYVTTSNSGTNNLGLTGLGTLGSGISTQGENALNNSNVGLGTNPSGMSTSPSVFSQGLPQASAQSYASASSGQNSLQGLMSQVTQLIQPALQLLQGGNSSTASSTATAKGCASPTTTINQSNAYNSGSSTGSATTNNCPPPPPPPPPPTTSTSSNTSSNTTGTSQKSTGDATLDQGMQIAENYLNKTGQTEEASLLTQANVHKGQLEEGAGGLTDGTDVTISNDETNPTEIASLLVHEGTHLVQNSELGNPDDSTELERQAYENQNGFNAAYGLDQIDIDATLNSSLYSNL
jgi:hypothetical protein